MQKYEGGRLKFDVLFVAPVGAKPYSHESLGMPGFGGVEMQTIQLAEAFALSGLRVGVAQRSRINSISPNGVEYFGPIDAIVWSLVKAKNMIFVRSEGKWALFPDSRKFIWFHEACTKEMNTSTWVGGMIGNNITGICVSDWHRENIFEYAPLMPVKRIYPAVDEKFFGHAITYSKNQIVWNASPHKGLNHAISIFEKIRALEPEMNLIVFNPGYFTETVQNCNVEYWNNSDQDVMRDVISQSLCLFYPTDFKETFGMIAAEANAMGIPVASYKIAALAESSVGPFFENEDQIIKQILTWRECGRPKIQGQERFRMKNILPQWLEMLE
jgi:glycosyltransferase involved in cell wall biosynthesis